MFPKTFLLFFHILVRKLTIQTAIDFEQLLKNVAGQMDAILRDEIRDELGRLQKLANVKHNKNGNNSKK